MRVGGVPGTVGVQGFVGARRAVILHELHDWLPRFQVQISGMSSPLCVHLWRLAVGCRKLELDAAGCQSPKRTMKGRVRLAASSPDVR